MGFTLSRLWKKKTAAPADKGGGATPLDSAQEYAAKIKTAQDKETYTVLYTEALTDATKLPALIDQWTLFAAGLKMNNTDFWRETLIALAKKSEKPVDTIKETVAKLPENIRQLALDESMTTAVLRSNSNDNVALYTGWFLDAGAKADANGSYALVHAAAQRNEDLVKKLLEKGAKFTDALRSSRITDYSQPTQCLLHFQKKLTGKASLPDGDPAIFETLEVLRAQMAEMAKKIETLESQVKTTQQPANKPPAI